MASPSKLLWCFPGGPRLWRVGDWKALGIGLLCLWLACLCVTATWVWPQWLSGWVVRSLWIGLGVGWPGLIVLQGFNQNLHASKPDPKSLEQSFRAAQAEYLRGNYFQAEAFLHRLLSLAPEDAEALLLMSSVLRRTQRPKQALDRLQQLERLEASSRWSLELQQELSRAREQLRASGQAETDEQSD
jgi:tetratricopeptide (TPR) repeat protein